MCVHTGKGETLHLRDQLSDEGSEGRKWVRALKASGERRTVSPGCSGAAGPCEMGKQDPVGHDEGDAWMGGGYELKGHAESRGHPWGDAAGVDGTSGEEVKEPGVWPG